MKRLICSLCLFCFATLFAARPIPLNYPTYDNASEEQKNIDPRFLRYIDINRKEHIRKVDFWSKNPYYSSNCDKYILKNYDIWYVRVRILDDNCLEINYHLSDKDDGYTTIRVLPLSYEITYFND